MNNIKTIILFTFLSMILISCSRSDDDKLDRPQIIPKGKGGWITVDQAMDIESLIGKEVEFDYRRIGQITYGENTSLIIKYIIVCNPTPLTPTDRCGMDVVKVHAVFSDGKRKSVPASGKIIDNSDGQVGFRVEL
jgi:hypothetical protein